MGRDPRVRFNIDDDATTPTGIESFELDFYQNLNNFANAENVYNRTYVLKSNCWKPSILMQLETEERKKNISVENTEQFLDYSKTVGFLAHAKSLWP